MQVTVDIQDKDGRTPLFRAVYFEEMNSIELLLKDNAIVNIDQVAENIISDMLAGNNAPANSPIPKIMMYW